MLQMFNHSVMVSIIFYTVVKAEEVDMSEEDAEEAIQYCGLLSPAHRLF